MPTLRGRRKRALAAGWVGETEGTAAGGGPQRAHVAELEADDLVDGLCGRIGGSGISWLVQHPGSKLPQLDRRLLKEAEAASLTRRDALCEQLLGRAQPQLRPPVVAGPLHHHHVTAEQEELNIHDT